MIADKGSTGSLSQVLIQYLMVGNGTLQGGYRWVPQCSLPLAVVQGGRDV